MLFRCCSTSLSSSREAVRTNLCCQDIHNSKIDLLVINKNISEPSDTLPTIITKMITDFEPKIFYSFARPLHTPIQSQNVNIHRSRSQAVRVSRISHCYRHQSWKHKISIRPRNVIHPQSSVHATVRSSRYNLYLSNNTAIVKRNHSIPMKSEASHGKFHTQKNELDILRSPPRTSQDSDLTNTMMNSSLNSHSSSQLEPPRSSKSKQILPNSLQKNEMMKKNDPSTKPDSKNQNLTLFDQLKPTHKSKKTRRKKACNRFCCSLCLRKLLLCILVTLIFGTATAAIVLGILRTVKITTSNTIRTGSCTSLCTGETWTFSSDLIARWTFDNTFADLSNTSVATALNNPTFTPTGYVNQAIFLDSTLMQSLFISNIPLAGISFTIETWIQPTAFPNAIDHAILGLCQSLSSYQCLHLLIRKNASNYYLYFGFYGDDCEGNSSIPTAQWTHVAFVFDLSTLTKSIYVNGQLDNRCTTSSALMTSDGNVTVGVIPMLTTINGVNYFYGYMDHLSITRRAKSSCEVGEDASLVSCFLFDQPDSYVDSGPNGLLSTESSSSIISTGYVGDGISFNGTAYFQTSSYSALGVSNTAFTILLWVRPQSLNRTLVHVSSISNGGSWCIPFIGIASNGSIVAQEYRGSASTMPSVSSSPISMVSVWTHIAQTWSVANGLRLYIDGTMVATFSSATSYTASGAQNFITLANSLSGMGTCYGGGLGTRAPGPFIGDVDDFRVYSRELTASEISKIYQS